MSHKPFPWFLQFPRKPIKGTDYRITIITMQSLGVDSVVGDFMWNAVNPKTENIEPVYHSYLIKEILETRLSRGDWTNYEAVPFFYDVRAECLGYAYKSELNPLEHEAGQVTL